MQIIICLYVFMNVGIYEHVCANNHAKFMLGNAVRLFICIPTVVFILYRFFSIYYIKSMQNTVPPG